MVLPKMLDDPGEFLPSSKSDPGGGRRTEDMQTFRELEDLVANDFLLFINSVINTSGRIH